MNNIPVNSFISVIQAIYCTYYIIDKHNQKNNDGLYGYLIKKPRNFKNYQKNNKFVPRLIINLIFIMNIFVSNLNFKVRSEDLKNLFQQYGEVVSSKVITDKFSGRSRGFGFVEMKNDADGQKAIDELNQKDYEGRNISVSVAKPRTEGPRPGQGHRHDSMAE